MISHVMKSPLYKIVNPQSIAFFGASNSFASMGTSCLASLLARGFEGEVYPVHPKEEVVQGLKAYKNVSDLPCAPDLAVMVIPTRLVCDAMEECGKKGIRHAIVVTAGFREVGGEGVALEEKLKGIAEKYGIRFIGPNCIGVTNPHHRLNTTFLEDNSPPGFIGLASQSGSFVTQMTNYLDRLGIGFSTAFSIGNGANIDLVDCLEYLGACPNTKVIAMYVEGVSRGKEFMDIARAIVPHKPITALYVGGSETGRKACFSHTGTMAGPDGVYEGMFRQCGIVRASSVAEMFDFAWVLGSLPAPEGPNVAIQTHSGGPGATSADWCGRMGLRLPSLSEETIGKLQDLVAGTASVNNPVDLTFSKNPMDFFTKIPQALVEDPAIHMLLTYYLMPLQTVKRPLMQMGLPEDEAIEKSNELMEKACDAVAKIKDECGKPVVGFTFRGLEEAFPKGLIQRGAPIFPTPERAVAALAALEKYGRFKSRLSH